MSRRKQVPLKNTRQLLEVASILTLEKTSFMIYERRSTYRCENSVTHIPLISSFDLVPGSWSYNPSSYKSQGIKLGPPDLASSSTFYMKHHNLLKTAIERITKFNLTVIYIYENVFWNTHLHYLCCKLSRTMCILNRLKHILPLYVSMKII